MKSRILGALAIGLGMVTQFANAQITYEVDRVVGAGTVTGFIETDGTLGVISTGNIINWELTLTAPDLAGGSSETIDAFSNFGQLFIEGAVVTATESDMFFDIDGASGTGLFILQGGSPNFNYYCIETADSFCTGGGIGEHIGFDEILGGNTQSAIPSGNFIFASVAATPITYTINREIGNGAVSGTITTDGTLGTLSTSNILAWEIALSAPNLINGPFIQMSSADQIQTFIDGTPMTATDTELFFDISGSSGEGSFAMQGSTGDFYCIETAFGGCTGAGIGEHIGQGVSDFVAQTAQPSGNVAIATTNPQPITYLISREVGAGTINGFITTNGTLGTLSSSDITNWELTLTAPNLFSGSPDTIDFATQVQTSISSNATTATSTQLRFDMTGASGEGFFLVQGGSFNYWCIETEFGGCTGSGIGEHIGFDTAGVGPAQTGFPTGNFVFAETQQNIVYEVSRRIGDGTITGFVETDGTLGVLATENIVNWQLELSASNLFGGPVDIFDFSTQFQPSIAGSMLTATTTGMFFDITGGSGEGYFLLQGGSSGNYWCTETQFGGCTGEGAGEYMGFNTDGSVFAQSSQPSGNVRLATNCLGDLTGDGTLDFFDVSAFLSAYTSMQSTADFNIDGVFNFFDVSAFLSAFNAGCP